MWKTVRFFFVETNVKSSGEFGDLPCKDLVAKLRNVFNATDKDIRLARYVYDVYLYLSKSGDLPDLKEITLPFNEHPLCFVVQLEIVERNSFFSDDSKVFKIRNLENFTMETLFDMIFKEFLSHCHLPQSLVEKFIVGMICVIGIDEFAAKTKNNHGCVSNLDLSYFFTFVNFLQLAHDSTEKYGLKDLTFIEDMCTCEKSCIKHILANQKEMFVTMFRENNELGNDSFSKLDIIVEKLTKHFGLTISTLCGK